MKNFDMRWRDLRIDEDPPKYAIETTTNSIRTYRVLQVRQFGAFGEEHVLFGEKWTEWEDVNFEGITMENP